MDSVRERTWTPETFLAWEDQQDGKHEFDGFRVIPMTGGSVAHQTIVFNLLVLLSRVLAGSGRRALHEMRLRIGRRFRYPNVVVTPGPVDQIAKTLTDAAVLFEILSDDTAATDRVDKLGDYADVPSLQYYIMLEQLSRAAVVCRREAGGVWTTHPVTAGAIAMPELTLVLPLDDIYRSLILAPREANDRLTD